MNSEFLVALLNPVVTGVAALLLVAIWMHHRDRQYILLFAGACVLGFVAFTIRDFGVRYGLISPALGRFVASCLFIGMALSVSAVTHIHYHRPVPVRLFALIALAEAAIFMWSLVVEDSLYRRTVIIHVTLILIVAVTFLRVVSSLRRTMVDFAVLIGMATAAIVLSLPVMFVGQMGDSDLFWTMTKVSTVLLVILLVLIFLVVLAAELMRSIRQEARVDVLSRLLNRRGMEEGIQKQRAAGRHPAALVLMDIDHFKRVNDSHGHAVGDEVIGACGDLLNTAAGPDVLAGRVGGEEFALYVAAGGPEKAAALAETLRVRLAGMRVSARVPDLRITASFGVARAGDGSDLTTLLAPCDLALYGAKRAGRNRVNVLTPTVPEVERAEGRRACRDRDP